jgi:hypothetical protein
MNKDTKNVFADFDKINPRKTTVHGKNLVNNDISVLSEVKKIDRNQNFVHVYSPKSHFARSQKIIMSAKGSYFYQTRRPGSKNASSGTD